MPIPNRFLPRAAFVLCAMACIGLTASIWSFVLLIGPKSSSSLIFYFVWTTLVYLNYIAYVGVVICIPSRLTETTLDHIYMSTTVIVSVLIGQCGLFSEFTFPEAKASLAFTIWLLFGLLGFLVSVYFWSDDMLVSRPANNLGPSMRALGTFDVIPEKKDKLEPSGSNRVIPEGPLPFAALQ